MPRVALDRFSPKECADHSQFRKVDLQAKRSLRNLFELESSKLVHNSHPNPFAISQQLQLGVIDESSFVPSKYLADQVLLSGIARDLDMYVEIFGPEHNLSGSCGPAQTGESRLNEAVEYERRHHFPNPFSNRRMNRLEDGIRKPEEYGRSARQMRSSKH